MPLLKQTSTDALASAARQLDYALQQSPTLDDAFQKLYATADERRQSTLKQLEGLLRSRESDSTASKTLRLSSYPTLKWLLSQATAPERSVAALLQDFRRHESFSATTTAVVWSEFAGFLTYLGAVLGVLIVVVLLYGIIILPQFRSLYGGFGRELPGFTQLVFGSGAWFFTLLLLGSLAPLIFLSWFVCLLRSRLRRYVPIPARHPSGQHRLKRRPLGFAATSWPTPSLEGSGPAGPVNHPRHGIGCVDARKLRITPS